MWSKLKKKRYLIPIQVSVAIVLCLSLLLTGTIHIGDRTSDKQTIGMGQKTISIGVAGVAYAAGTPDYACDGVADDVQFQLAFNALPATGGKIVVLGGVYTFNATVTRAIDNITVQGMGFSSFISRDGINPIFTIGAQSNWTFMNLRLDAGGVSDALATEVTYENVDVGGTHWAYDTSIDIGGASWDVPTGRGTTLVVAASNAYANSIAQADYICDGTNDEVEIQTAINALPAGGGTIQLTDGLYDIVKGVGEPIITFSSNVTLTGQGNGTVLRLANNTNAATRILHVPAGVINVHISELQMDVNGGNQAAGTYYPISIQGTAPGGDKKYCSVSKVLFVDNYYGADVNLSYADFNTVTENMARSEGVIAAGAEIVGLDFSDYNVISNNTIFDCGNDAIDLYESSSNVVANNISMDTARGVVIRSDSDNNIVDGNSITDVVTYGISVTDDSDGNLITGNHIVNPGTTGILATTGGGVASIYTLITSNYIEGGTSGIYVEQGDYSQIENNTMLSGVGTGIQVDTSDYVSVANNSVSDYGLHGIQLNGTNYSLVSENILEGNGTDTNNTFHHIYLQGTSSYNTVRDNILRQGAGGNRVKYGILVAATADYNIITANDMRDSAVTTYMNDGSHTSLLVAEGCSDIFMDVLAVSATHVRSNEDLSAGIPITFTKTQPDVPRTLSGHFDAHANITAYTIVITGWDAKGDTVIETLTEADGWDWETSNAFGTIYSIIMTTRTGTGAGDTMDIGITDVLGLSNDIYVTGDVYKIKKNNANAVVAGAQVDIAYDTYDMAVIGLGATDDFTIWFRNNLNVFD